MTVIHIIMMAPFALCTNPPLAAMISGCLVVVPILGSGMKLLVLFY